MDAISWGIGVLVAVVLLIAIAMLFTTSRLFRKGRRSPGADNRGRPVTADGGPRPLRQPGHALDEDESAREQARRPDRSACSWGRSAGHSCIWAGVCRAGHGEGVRHA
ncbi:hypothetical protein [Streptomyces lavendofoliae]|uniref:hypothetical protein n=1 Tax=Streptomyces lavendofoliae TaxID=67314 RepID=UPI00300EDF42